MNAIQMIEKLMGVPEGSKLFVSYIAGRPPSDTAKRQARRNAREGIARRHFTGTYTSVRMTKRGHVLLTMWVEERDSGDPMRQGAYRAFNPSLGTLLSLEVLEKRTPQVPQTT